MRHTTIRPLILSILAASLVSVAVAQEGNPFAAPATGGDAASASAAANPFDTGTAAAPAGPGGDATFQPDFGANPFDAGSAPSTPPPAGTDANPFGGASAGATNPFGAAPTGTGAPATVTAANPFGNVAATASNLFGGLGFGGAPRPATAEGGTGRGVAQLYTFRFVARLNDQNELIVGRKKFTMEEGEALDERMKQYYITLANAGQLPGYVPGAGSVDEWARWMSYANQLELWAVYCDNLLKVSGVSDFSAVEQIKWPGDPTAEDLAAAETGGADAFAGEEGREGAGTRPRPTAPPILENENRSLDDQAADFLPLPDTNQGTQGRPVITPEQIDEMARNIYLSVFNQLRDVEEEQTEFIAEMFRQLKERGGDLDMTSGAASTVDEDPTLETILSANKEAATGRRAAYAQWRDEQRNLVADYMEDWQRRFEGKVVVVGGVQYELFRPGNEPKTITRGANVVVTDYDITPYDMINADGSLRGASN